MLIVNKLIPQAQGLAAALLKRASSVELGWDVRQKSRFDATDSAGRMLGFFLPRGTTVRGGDALVVEDGTLVLIKAAAQPVLVVRPCSEHGTPCDLLRAAYHLGNRHVAVELKPDHLKLEPDPVLATMLRRMHLIVAEENAPFEPESGAYQAQPGHGDDHAPEHGHAHDQGHDHDHVPEHTHEQGRPRDQGHDHDDHHHHQGHDHGAGHDPHGH